MSYREGQFHIKQTKPGPQPPPVPHTHPPLGPPTTPCQGFVYSFCHYSMSRTPLSYRPFDRQLETNRIVPHSIPFR